MTVPQEPIAYISRQTFAELLHDNSGKYEITTPHDLMGDDLVPIFTLPEAHPSDPAPAVNVQWSADEVINLVIAAREAFDCAFLPDEENRSLDKALEPFAGKVRYANEPDDAATASEGSADA